MVSSAVHDRPPKAQRRAINRITQIYYPDLQSADSTAAVDQNFLLRSVDASACTKKISQVAAVAQPKQLEAARCSRACAYLADDDHGPLALQEILLAGCPTVGLRTGASFVKTGETGVLVDRLPPGQQCVETDEDERALTVYLEAVEQAQAMDRESVRQLSAEQFDTGSTVDQVITTLASVRESTLSDATGATCSQ